MRNPLAEYEKQGYRIMAIRTNVSDPDSTKEMAAKMAERFGRIDTLVKNAGIMFAVKVSKVPIYELDLDKRDRVMLVDVKGPLLCARAVFPYMKAQGAGKKDHQCFLRSVLPGGGDTSTRIMWQVKGA